MPIESTYWLCLQGNEIVASAGVPPLTDDIAEAA